MSSKVSKIIVGKGKTTFNSFRGLHLSFELKDEKK